jgi:hypothetical protein
MKKRIFSVLLACLIFEIGGFITLAVQGRQPALALTLAGLMLLPAFFIVRELTKKPQPKPVKF